MADSGSGSDSDRPLSVRGRETVRHVAQGFRRFDREPKTILSSPLLRARQTADLLSEAVRPAQPPGITRWLLPDQDPDKAVAWVRSLEGPATILVGHQPLLARLACTLVFQDWQPFLSVETAGVVVNRLRL